MEVLTGCIIGTVISIIGIILRFYPPKSVNRSIGYKTPFAMKNKDTWYEGNRFFGTMIIFVGIIFSIVSLLIRDSKINLPILILFILFILSFIFTEIYLRKIFNKDGTKRNK